MACFNPLVAYRAKMPNAVTGKFSMVFNSRDAACPDDPLKLPCGQCIGCRLERSRQWAIRCVHEASLYERNCFITLTFAPEFLPKSGSLSKRDFQLFMKRLRKRFGAGARYFMCGEYGELNRRPHYHACLFNFDFPDRELWSVRGDVRLYVSRSLSELWPFGFSTIGDVTFDSAAYVARYITKKITGDMASSHYERVDPVSGEVNDLLPEFTTMSRRPGIGRGWFDRFRSDVFPHDRVVLDGRELRPPKYYDRIFDVDFPGVMEDVKEARVKGMKAAAKDFTFERLRTREQHQFLMFDKLKRGYENES
ncbi:MAG: replication initiator protein [Microviridae sp.]|nr:MAG: replication initiator protein [Microviridae sp.]